MESAWLALGGPAGSEDTADLEDVERYLNYLQDKESAGTLPSVAEFETGLARLYAAPDPRADERLQIMTIHKAKGLEFDTVIVPGLGRTQRREDSRLMVWVERARAGEQRRELLLAPIRESGTESDAIYDYIAGIDRDKQSHETVRLLYVAATRARSRLHLLGGVSVKRKDDGAEPGVPTAGSLLLPLWPAVRDEFAAAFEGRAMDGQAPSAEQQLPRPSIRRLASDWIAPAPPQPVAFVPANELHAERYIEVEFAWASETAKHVGTVVHRYLQGIADEGPARWDGERLANAASTIARELARLGVPRDESAQALSRVQGALSTTLADERGRWILSAQSQSRSELRLTGVVDQLLVNVAIDRTFVDDHGTRWIIDFKTGTHEGSAVERFLDEEQLRYRPQLARYASLMQQLDNRPIRLGLYFPMLGAWREWNHS